MTSATLGAAILQIHRLFDEGTVAGLSDGQLLERFVDSRDERAFEAIVTRHGPMVLATCRAVLRDRHASEDAFQAAFASLVRRASTLRNADALGGWLHRVAYREAVRAGSETSRRRAIERKALPPAGTEEADLGDLRVVVHAELDRLPESLRLPVVLCDLEGLTKGQAAQHLGWTEGTVRGRLERARVLLRSRLARRGLGASAGLLVGSIGGGASAEVGATRVASAVRAAMAAGGAAGPSIAGWLKVTATLAAIGLVGLAGFGVGRPGFVDRAEPEPTPARRTPAAPPEAPDPGKPVEVVGRVVDPEGRPVAGAIVRLQPSPTSLPREPEPTATTGDDGRFSVRGPRWAFKGREPWWGPQVVATAPGFGPGRTFVGHVVESPGEVTVRLVADDLPIDGKVVDLEGRAVPGASIRVSDVYVPTGVDLSKWLEKVRQYGTRGPWEGSNTRELDYLPNLPGATAATGPDGRFRLHGVGRERIAALIVSGPNIATEEIFAMTRTGPAVKTADRGPGEKSLTFHAARLEHVANPTRPIEGVIADKDTGTPLAGVKVEGMVFDDNSSIAAPGVGTTTDAEGRYRLLGLGQAARYRLFVKPAPDRPYIPASIVVDAGPIAPSAVTHDVALKRGVLVRGRITDKVTGRPVERAVIWPYTFIDNPRVAEYPGYRSSERQFVRSDAEGRFAIATLPGRGLIAAQADFDSYLLVKGLDAIAGYDPEQMNFATHPATCSARNHHAIVEIRPEAGPEPFICDIQVDPGSTMTGTVLDPEGREISGVMTSHLGPFAQLALRPQEAARFEAKGVDPDRPRRASFFHEGRKLAGSIVIPGDGPDPAIVRLQPWGTVTGRVVDDEGRPVSGFSLGNGPAAGRFDPDRGFLPTNERIELDRDGRFRIERLVPGLAYKAHASKDNMLYGPVFEGVRVEPGKVKDVGDVKITPFRD